MITKTDLETLDRRVQTERRKFERVKSDRRKVNRQMEWSIAGTVIATVLTILIATIR